MTIDTTIALLSLAVSVIGLGIGAWSLPSWQDYQTWLKTDPDYRRKIATALRHPRWVAFYRDGLAKALDWLDRRFGEADSARALGVCTVISLCYAWAAFFLSYGMGQPGRLGEIDLLPSAHGPTDRALLVATDVILPVVAFLFGRWLGALADRAERRLKARLLRRQRRLITKHPDRAKTRLKVAIGSAVLVFQQLSV